MLLVVSRSLGTDASAGVVSCVSVWDFLEGHKDILCKSHLPLSLVDARWNPFLSDSNEFVTVAARTYHYWKINNSLNLCYQEGDIPKKKDVFTSKDEKLETLEFVVPIPEQISTYLLIGLSSGYVWVLDSRANQYLYNVKVLDSAVRIITSNFSRIVVEG